MTDKPILFNGPMNRISGTPKQHTLRPPREPRKPGATLASMQAVSRHQRGTAVTMPATPWDDQKRLEPKQHQGNDEMELLR